MPPHSITSRGLRRTIPLTDFCMTTTHNSGDLLTTAQTRDYDHRVDTLSQRAPLRPFLSELIEDVFYCRCPVCQGGLRRKDIQLHRFNCPHCFRQLRPCFFPGYLWVRALIIFGLGLAWAWHSGWTDSFVIFVASFYGLPVAFLWDLVVREFFLPKKLEPITLTLSLGSK